MDNFPFITLFGGVRSPAVQRVELNEYGFRCRTPLVTLSL
jgi:hypothetical protein